MREFSTPCYSAAEVWEEQVSQLKTEKERRMSGVIPEEYVDLFNKRAFGHLATLMPDGHPQVTPVWCDFDGTHVIVNSARGRVKDHFGYNKPQLDGCCVHFCSMVLSPERAYQSFA